MPTPFALKLAGIAEDLHTKYHMQNENDPELGKEIAKFWKDSGLSFPGVGTAWSAVFVSACVKRAGATKAEFKFADSHSTFVNQAIKNADAGTGVFRGRDVAIYAPKVGDIIHNNRNGNSYNFAYARKHDSYFSHSAIVVETGTDSNGRYALTIGGNESDSIRRTIVRLNANGLIKQRTSNPFICVIEDLK